MDTIKSAKAKNHIEKWQWQSKGGTFDNSPIILRSIAEDAVIIAETEADERHRHETRWRSVEEELPEDQRIVMVKTNKNSFATAYLHGKSSGFITYGDTAYLDFGKITHWKPIE